MKLTKKQLWIGGGYIVFMLLFFFIGIPKVKLLDGFLGAVLVTAFYAVIALIVNGIYEGSKPKP
jgi:hypothetical protein